MKWLFAIGFIFCSHNCASQILEETLERQLETMQNEKENEPDETLEEEWSALLKDPIDINRANESEWNVFPFITSLQIKSLARYKQMFGDLVSVYELQAVPYWNAGDLEKIKPYITVRSEEGIFRWKDLWKGESMLLFREKIVLEKKKEYGLKENGYTGSPHHVLFSYRYRYRKLLDVGLIAEKDPGETMFGKQIKTFDFVSFHIYKKGSGIIKNIALGDFTVNYGQGLIHWQSRSFGKGSLVIAVKKEALSILPYASSNEINFHRGIGLIVQKAKLQGSLFFALQKQSSAVHAGSSDFFGSVNTSGLHRTESELSQRKKLGYTSAGLSLHYLSANYRAGINLIHHLYSARRESYAYSYNLYDQNGRAFSNAGIDYELTYRNMHFFGEAAIDQQLSPAIVAGVLTAADRNLDISMIFRSLSKDYRAISANAFAEGSSAENETGFYTGIAFRPSESWKLEGYFDLFRFPWLRYRVDRPSAGADFLLTMTCKPNKIWEIYGRFKAKYMEINTDADYPMHQTVSTSRKSLKIHLRNALGMNTVIKASAEMVWYNRGDKVKEDGFSGYVELSFRPFPNLSANFRATCFETSGFDSRVYVYESGLPYSGEIPFLNGSGFRYYLNTRLIINKNLSLALRLSQTLYSEKTVIGSGPGEIGGPRVTKLEMQVQQAF